MYLLYTIATALLASRATASPVSHSNHLPIVELGYLHQQASDYNATGRYYTFSNIPYAQPPVGPLRFSRPQAHEHIPGVQTGGSIPIECPAAWPKWLAKRLTGSEKQPPHGLGESEDCLYLDVFVPEKILRNKQYPAAPVLIWIHGGGDVIGSKSSNGPPDGILARSLQDTDSEGVIFVALNYRLGAFGWLGGSKYTSQGGVPNLGLLDQRFALEWVQQNIHLFGGDATRVTVMGESGGAASIGHHLTAGIPGNDAKLPFQQAIFQSTAELPRLDSDLELNSKLSEFLGLLNITTLSEARALDSSLLVSANNQMSYNAPTGSFVFGPSRDGSYVLGTLYEGLAHGRFNHNIKIMTSYNANEGTIFIPDMPSNYTFQSYINSVVAGASSSTIDYIADELYPESDFANAAARASEFIGDALIDCNAYALQRAYDFQGYAYGFSLPDAVDAIHTADLTYTFWDGVQPQGPPVNPAVAVDMQAYFTNFAVHGDPNAGSAGRAVMPKYGQHGRLLNLTADGYHIVEDPKKGSRCEFWAAFKESQATLDSCQ